jgi:hypothetical protein
MKQKV